jgi:putative flippase GtrA
MGTMIISSFQGKKLHFFINNEMSRFIIVGLASFAVDFGTLCVLTELGGIYYLTSAAIAFIFGITFNYVLSILWVFHKRLMAHWVPEFILFVLIGLCALGLNQLVMWYFTSELFIHYTISKIIATSLVAICSFIAKKVILFR